MPLEAPVCSVCRRRPAVYRRTYSGDLLCSRCLERALEKAVRRSLGEAGVLAPRTTLLVPIALSLPREALALARLVARVERGYGSRVIVAIPHSLDAPQEALPKEENIKIKIIKLETKNIDDGDPVACARLERRWSLLAARRLGASAVVMPYTRTDLALLLLHAVLSGDRDAISESLPLISWTQPPVISGFSRAEGEIVAAYTATRQILAEPACNPDLSLAKLVFYSIAGRRPELEFSFLKSLSLLSKPPRDGICEVCGGYSSTGTVCRYCASTDLNLSIYS